MTKGTEGTFIVHYREGTCLVLLASVISMPYQKCVKKCYSNKHFHLSSVFFFFFKAWQPLGFSQHHQMLVQRAQDWMCSNQQWKFFQRVTNTRGALQ